MWKLNNTVLNNQLVKEESRQIKKYPRKQQNILSSEVHTEHRTFSRRDHILGHKWSLSKFKKTEIISNIFSNHNTMRLQINYRKKYCKKHKHVEAKQYVIKYHWITEEINEEIKNN